MTRPRNWTAGMALVALCAFLVGFGAWWLLADRWPLGTAQVSFWGCLTASCVYVSTAKLRAELEACRARLAAWNGSESRDDLAAVGPISPAAGTRAVGWDYERWPGGPELYDQDADSIVHWAPDDYSSGVTRCCARTPFELPRTDRLTLDDNVVTCRWTQDAVCEHCLGRPIEDVCPVCLRSEADGLSIDPAARGESRERAVGVLTNLRSIVDHGIPQVDHDRMRRALDSLPGTDDLGQVCAECGARAGGGVAEHHLDPDGSEVTEVRFLCDACYAAAMAAEHEDGA
jgi:hypothetical protein